MIVVNRLLLHTNNDFPDRCVFIKFSLIPCDEACEAKQRAKPYLILSFDS